MTEDIVVPEDEEAAFVPPTSVDATSYSPGDVEPSSAPYGALPDTDAEQEAEEERPLPVFDPKYRSAVEGLLFLGKIQKTFSWAGHQFIIRTPTVEDLLEVGLLHAPYSGTLADIKAYQSLMLAATLVSVDGSPLPLPISDTESALEAKFGYISKHWYPWTLDKLYEEYMLLDGDVQLVYDALGKA